MNVPETADQHEQSAQVMPIHLIASHRTIESMPPGKRRSTDGRGLHIPQTDGGTKYWYLDYTFKGKRYLIRGARWGEFDLDRMLWRVPAARMNGRQVRKVGGPPHLAPLCRQAAGILRDSRDFTGNGPDVFPGQGRVHPVISDSTLTGAIRRMGFSTQTAQTVHGFRAMARTMLVERLKWPDSVIEMQFEHVVRGANRRAYNRTRLLEARAAMLQQWADYLDLLPAGNFDGTGLRLSCESQRHPNGSQGQMTPSAHPKLSAAAAMTALPFHGEPCLVGGEFTSPDEAPAA